MTDTYGSPKPTSAPAKSIPEATPPRVAKLPSTINMIATSTKSTISDTADQAVPDTSFLITERPEVDSNASTPRTLEVQPPSLLTAAPIRKNTILPAPKVQLPEPPSVPATKGSPTKAEAAKNPFLKNRSRYTAT